MLLSGSARPTGAATSSTPAMAAPRSAGAAARDRRQQLGLILARDRGQRRRLAEPGRAPPPSSSSVARTSAARVVSIRPVAITNGSRSGIDSGSTSIDTMRCAEVSVTGAAYCTARRTEIRS